MQYTEYVVNMQKTFPKQPHTDAFRKHQNEATLPKLKKKSEMRSFKSSENIHKKEGGSYYVVSANKASSVTL